MTLEALSICSTDGEFQEKIKGGDDCLRVLDTFRSNPPALLVTALF